MEKIVAKIIEHILENMSPELRGAIVDAVRLLETKAKVTKNPWDDILVMILKVALGIN